MTLPEPLTTYLELRESTAEGAEGEGLSHRPGGMFLLHVLEVAARGEPRGGVTILHDAGDHGARYLATANRLAESRWAVALPDMRGHGRSEGERGHSAGLDEILRDLDAVQQHLSYRLPIAPKVLIGQGLGALYALAFALERIGQVAALVLLAPLWTARFDLPQGTGLFKRFKRLGPTTPGAIGNDPERLTGDPGEQADWRADPLVHDVITLRAASQAAAIASRYVSRLREVDCPMLLLHGSADTIADPATSRAFAGEKVEVRIREGLRHDLLHERGAGELALEIGAWLEAKARA